MPDLLLTLYLLLVLPLRAIWRSLHPSPAASPLPPLRSYRKQAVRVLLLYVAIAAVAVLQGHTFGQLGLDLPLSPAGAWALGAAALLLVAGYLIGRRMNGRMSEDQRIKEENALRELPFVMPRTGIETAAYVLTMTAMTALWELLYRGYLLLVLTPWTGMPGAIALAAIAYGAGHGYQNPRQFFGSIAAAFAFTIGYALTGSLWWLIVLHAAAPVAMLYGVRKLQAAAAQPTSSERSTTCQ